MRFAAPWDGRLRLTTGAICVTFVLAAGVLVWLARTDGDSGATIVAIGGAGLLGGMVVLSGLHYPIANALEGGTLRILRRLRPREIPLSRVRAAGPVGPVLRGAVRLGGSSGLFGWFGRYWTRSLGQLDAYATRTVGLVQLDTPEGRFILSPEPADAFLDEVLAHAPGAARVPTEGPHARHPIPRRTWVRLAALLLGILAIVAAIVVGSFGWAPEGVTVDHFQIAIARRWVEPVEIRIADVRKVEIVSAGRVGRVHKIAGFVDPRGRAWGRFRADGLGEFRLFAWRRGPWVLLDTEDGKIVLTPDDPENFVGEVGAALALRPR